MKPIIDESRWALLVYLRPNKGTPNSTQHLADEQPRARNARICIGQIGQYFFGEGDCPCIGHVDAARFEIAASIGMKSKAVQGRISNQTNFACKRFVSRVRAHAVSVATGDHSPPLWDAT